MTRDNPLPDAFQDDGWPARPRAAFLQTPLGQAWQPWLEAEVEPIFGRLRRIERLRLADGRLVLLAEFPRSWFVHVRRPGQPGAQQLFLSAEGLAAVLGLDGTLVTWAAVRAALERLDL
jgi:hypothetical protein